MGKLLTHTLRIPDNAADCFGRCRPGALLNICQETGNMHSIEIGYANDDLPEGFSWVLVKAFLRLERPLKRQEEITVSTWYRGSAGAQVYRDYDVYANGVRAGEVITSWIMFDLIRQRPVRPDIAKETDLIYTPPEPKTVIPSKPERPGETHEAGTRPVRYSDLDMNGHMNNIVYLDVVCDTLRLEEHAGVFLKSAEIHYVGQTLPGQTLELETGDLSDGRHYVSGAVSGKRSFEALAELGGL
ncbi:MAG: thioesterase [Oscillospiraceae bacterium]|nr:thioesterase [Oscillospiraceae bacterium]